MSDFNEPWRCDRHSVADDFDWVNIIGADGKSFAIDLDEMPRSLRKINRIIACVNALAGVPTEDIERVVNFGYMFLQTSNIFSGFADGKSHWRGMENLP